MGRRRVHARARRGGADGRLAGRPLRPPSRVRARASSSSRSLRRCARPRARSRCSTRRARSRASARRCCSPPRWRCWPTRSRTRASARGALAAYGATIGASFAIGPAVGGALTTGLGWRWVFLVNVPIGLAVLVVTLHAVRESRDRARAPGRRARPGDAHRRPVPARARAAARQRAGLGQRGDRRRAGRRRRAARRVRRDRRRASAHPMLPLGAVPLARVHRRAADGVRDLGSFFAVYPLRDDLPAARARAVRDRGRPRRSCRARW